jgi:hypothetical protein
MAVSFPDYEKLLSPQAKWKQVKASREDLCGEPGKEHKAE